MEVTTKTNERLSENDNLSFGERVAKLTDRFMEETGAKWEESRKKRIDSFRICLVEAMYMLLKSNDGRNPEVTFQCTRDVSNGCTSIEGLVGFNGIFLAESDAKVDEAFANAMNKEIKSARKENDPYPEFTITPKPSVIDITAKLIMPWE